MKIRDYERKWDRPAQNNFAAACFENSIYELIRALRNKPDIDDMNNWGLIHVYEYYDAIEAALTERLEDEGWN